MRSVVAGAGLSLEEFDAFSDVRGCGVWLLLCSAPTLEHAVGADYALRRRHGRSWGGYRADDADLTLTEDAEKAFALAAAEVLQTEGAAGRCKVEWFKRVIPDEAGGDDRHCIQATIYREQPPRSELQFNNDDDVEPVIVRPVAEAALVVDPKEGAVDVCARGGKAVLESLAKAFFDAASESNVAVEPIAMRRLHLTSLAKRPSFPTKAIF